jgi:replicative DNA helicase
MSTEAPTTEAPTADRSLPHDGDAERTLLGAVLIDNGVWGQVGRLQASDFYREAHRRIFVALQQLGARGAEMDTITLKNALGADLAKVGGTAFLSSLTDGLPRVTNVGSWLAIVRRCAALRNIHYVGARLAQATLSEDADPGTILERADAHLLKLMARASSGAGLRDNAEVVARAYKNICERAEAPYGILGYRLGIESLDRIVQGVQGERMVIIAARLGEGKSAFALQVAAQIAAAISAQEPGKVVVFSSLEMSAEELMERRLAYESNISPSNLWAYTEQERAVRLAKIADVADRVTKSSLRVLEDAWTVSELRFRCREVQHEHGLAAVFVDYAQLLDAEMRARARNEEVASISKALRRLCKELKVPVFVVAQLSRDPVKTGPQGGRRAPRMDDLAESDALGRDCHVGILIDQDPVVPKDPSNPKAGSIEKQGYAHLHVRKNRGGAKGKTLLKFDGAVSMFYDEEHA